MLRHIAKNLVANGYAKKCEIQISYAIGVEEPISIHINTFGTGTKSEEELIKIIKESKERIKPTCKYYYECGGCNLMHMDYNSQLEFKKNKIESIFKKICNMDIKLSSINSYNIQNYRNRTGVSVK